MSDSRNRVHNQEIIIAPMVPNIELLIGGYSSKERNSHRNVPGQASESPCPSLSVSPEHVLATGADVPHVPVDFAMGPGVF